jgi:hypothetical protein
VRCRTDNAVQHLAAFIVMEDPLRYIDLDYYRSARLLIARAEIAQLRRQSSALALIEQQIRNEPSRAVDDSCDSNCSTQIP